MSETINLETKKHITVISYKARNGEIKDVHFIQELEPEQRTLSPSDLQMLGKAIAAELKKDE